jgi:hypothetical protein
MDSATISLSVRMLMMGMSESTPQTAWCIERPTARRVAPRRPAPGGSAAVPGTRDRPTPVHWPHGDYSARRAFVGSTCVALKAGRPEIQP